MKFAGVIVDISHEQLDKIFQYIIPDELLHRVEIGCRVKIPFGRTTRTGYVVDISEEAEIEPDRIKPLIEVITESVTIDGKLIRLANWMKNYYGSTMYQALKVVIPIKEKVKPVTKKTIHLLISGNEAREIASEARRKKHMAQARLLEALADNPVADFTLLNQKLDITMSTVNSLDKKGLIEIETSVMFRNAVRSRALKKEKPVLNDEQKFVTESIIEDFKNGDNTPCFIKGVTGSGKTEVYMELIEWNIERGKEVICLIPEISLTYQTVMRFYNRFGDNISIINSRMSKGERYDSFLAAKEGRIKIMIGPRSALFTPFNNLGLIIIDEEHENAYKSENVPKYHARETAVELAKISGAKVVFGSATPSLDTYYRAKNGVYKLFTMENRAGSGTLPVVETVDLRDEMKNGNRSVFSRRLLALMEEKLQKKEQIMLFLNRRGYRGFINCRDCGHIIECPHCAVSMTEHKSGKLICHYCGYEAPIVKICPECGSKHIGKFKAGTELIEEETRKLFPNAFVLRMDLDTTKGKDGHADILEKFADGEADILIGTQMIVKGHDFPNVTLVGILLADMSLYSPDYMAAERSFELLTQAAGRAGRGDKKGNVIIQTYNPEHYSIVHACKHDFDSFYEEEIAYREMMGYPPVLQFMSCKIASLDEEKAVYISEEIKKITAGFAEDTRIIGPGNAPVYKINDIYYRIIYYKNSSHERLEEIKKSIDRYMDEHEEIFKKCQIQYDFR